MRQALTVHYHTYSNAPGKTLRDDNPQMPEIVVPAINRAQFQSKLRYFAEVQLWPLQQKLDPLGWLSNFQDEDQEVALQALNSFAYFSNTLIDQLFLAAIRLISSAHITDEGDTYTSATVKWNAFLDAAIFTFPARRRLTATDSGNLFLRKARALLRVDESRTVAPPEAIERVLTRQASNVVFVDDFAGTGEQFIHAWEHKYTHASRTGYSVTFADLAREGSATFYYCPCICTATAAEAITAAAPGHFNLCTPHIIGPEFGYFGTDSAMWPTGMRDKGIDALLRAGKMLELPESNGSDPMDTRGYGHLGLGLAFEHAVPDATSPLFTLERPNWRPLWRP